MIPDRAPSSIWCLSRNNLGSYVRTEADDKIVVVGPDDCAMPSAIVLTRSEARLLAKRINECLDATVKR